MPTPEARQFVDELITTDFAEWAEKIDRFAAQRGEVETQIARDSFERGVEVGELLPREAAPPQTGGGEAGGRAIARGDDNLPEPE